MDINVNYLTPKTLQTLGLVLLFGMGCSINGFSASGIPIGNSAPVVADDSFGATSGQTLNINEPGVLANDSDSDGDAITSSLVSGVTNGTLTLNDDGSFSYTPNDGFTGDDTFTYLANDGFVDSSSATVTITVSEATNIPQAAFTPIPAEGFAPHSVAFDASASSDPNGRALVAYRWFFGRGAPVITTTPTTTFTYNQPGVFTATLFVVNEDGLISPPAFQTVVVSDGVVNDRSLYLSKANFKINWKKHASGTTADTFKASGFLNPRAFPDTLAGTVQVVPIINGAPLTDPLDPKSARASGDPSFTAKLKSTNGAYTITAKNIDLRGFFSVQNVSESKSLRTSFRIRLIGGTLPEQTFRGAFDFDYSSTQDKTAKGTFSFKSQDSLRGAFISTKTSATELSDGSYKISFKGVIAGSLALAVVPTGDVTVQIGDVTNPSVREVITIPLAAFSIKGDGGTSTYTYSKSLQEITTLKKFQINNAKRTFSLITNGLTNTGIPASTAADVTYNLVLQFSIPTDQVVMTFQTIVEVKRSAGSKKWKR